VTSDIRYVSREKALVSNDPKVRIFYCHCLHNDRRQDRCIIDKMTIDILPDNVLLEIFHFYKDDPASSDGFTWRWTTLIHACRRWRHIVFGSPRRLDLRLRCSDRTPTKRLLDIWPPFPIALYVMMVVVPVNEEGLENIMAAVERRDRTSFIYIYDSTNGSALKKSIAVMHEPFPILKACSLTSNKKLVSMPVLPAKFLGGSAPSLRAFTLSGIPFPTFPNFVLSSYQIQNISFCDIPDSGYISPEIMATCLAALPKLVNLSIGFRSPLSRPVQRAPPPLKLAVLHALTSLSFEGVSEYFEDFIARINSPRLMLLSVTFFMDLIFDISRLHDFMNCTERADQASMEFGSQMTKIILESQAPFRFELGIKCERLDWQLSSMTQMLSQQLLLLSQIEYFQIREPHYPLSRIGWEDDPDMDPLQWLELFRLLISVQNLYVSERLVNRVAAALKELTGEMATEVLPVLRSISLQGLQVSGPVQDALTSFVTARQQTGHPVVIQPWEPNHPWEDTLNHNSENDG
jgi:hypothetical protein